jgi:predicted nucleic-acid-binding protein
LIGLDTNVLIRYLTHDDPAQAGKATRVIERAAPGELFVSAVVMCEIVWVLEVAYKQKRESIAGLLESMLQVTQFAFEHKDLLWHAVADYRRGKGDLSDYLIGRIAKDEGCSYSLTFDAALKSSEHFRVL